MADWVRLGQYVIRGRVARGWGSTKAWAQVCGVNHATLRFIEKGEHESYSGTTLARVEESLGWEPGSVQLILSGAEPVLTGREHRAPAESDWGRLGREVTRARVAKGWDSAAALARDIGVSDRTMRDLERARKRSYSRTVLAKVEAALGWETGSVDAILEGGDPLLAGQMGAPDARELPRAHGDESTPPAPFEQGLRSGPYLEDRVADLEQDVRDLRYAALAAEETVARIESELVSLKTARRPEPSEVPVPKTTERTGAPRLLSVEDVAARLSVPPSWVKEKVARREIPCTKIGRHTRFTEEQIKEIIELGKERPIVRRKRV